MRRQLLLLALALAGCGQAPTQNPEPPKTAPASVPATSVPASTSAPTKSGPAPQRDMVSVVTANGVEEAQGMGDPEKAKVPSSKTFKNAKLLGDISGGRFMASMQSMSASVGGDCGFCHKEDDFSSDANGHKVISRQMIEMSFAINRDHFDNKVAVSCYTCHQGKKKPPVADAKEEKPKKDEMSAADKKKPSGEFYKNVSVLKDLPAGELRPLMKKFNDALGVSCDFCHVKGEFESDDKPEKATARAMLKMTTSINKTYFTKKKPPAITCATCHHGAKEPAVSVGPKVLIAATVKEQTSWRALFGVAKWPTPPKTRAELEEALQKTSPNEAISMMLSHSDTGELGHLPPGDYQLCGFALPAKPGDDKLKEARPVSCQPLTITATPSEQTTKIEFAAP